VTAHGVHPYPQNSWDFLGRDDDKGFQSTRNYERRKGSQQTNPKDNDKRIDFLKIKPNI
jgi:hypothetical protein